jgi:hypothetical protein
MSVNEKREVRVESGALHEDSTGNIVLRGALARESIKNINFSLRADTYQRERLSSRKIEGLKEAFKSGQIVPDVFLGMRGGNYQEHKDGSIVLLDPVYIVDGLQRCTAAAEAIAEGGKASVGAAIYFNTTREWEKKKFEQLNTLGTKLSPSVHIRNYAEDYPVVAMLFQLTQEADFPLVGKVSWNQPMKKTELVTALTFLLTCSLLHSRMGSLRSANYRDVIPALQVVYNRVGRSTMRDNLRAFWGLLDECWQVRDIAYKDSATVLRGGFLATMATILADHEAFWKDANLFIERDLRRKIGLFPLNDPQVARLASYGRG